MSIPSLYTFNQLPLQEQLASVLGEGTYLTMRFGKKGDLINFYHLGSFFADLARVTEAWARKHLGDVVGVRLVHALLAISALSDKYSGYVEVRELVAAKLAAPTRLRQRVRALVLAGYVIRKRRYGCRYLLLTDTGKRAVRDCILATHRIAVAFLNPSV